MRKSLVLVAAVVVAVAAFVQGLKSAATGEATADSRASTPTTITADFDLTLPRLERKPYVWQPGPKQTDRDLAATTLIRAASDMKDDDRFKTSMECIERYPETQYASIARYWACNVVLKQQGPAAAMEFVNEQEAKDPANRGGLEAALFEIAKKYFNSGCDEEFSLLERILNDYGQTPNAATAMVAMAQFFSERNDRTQEVAWLKRAIEFEAPEELGHWLPDHYDARNMAIQRLARHYESVGAWDKALAMWPHWETGSDCGNCADARELGNCMRIMKCLCHLNRHDEAAPMAWDHLMKYSSASITEISWLLYVLYRDAGQLSDLKSMSRAYVTQVRKDGYIDEGTKALDKMIQSGKFPRAKGDESLPPQVPAPKRGSLPKKLPPLTHRK